MGKKLEHMTVEECRAQVFADIPYIVGQGTQINQRRTRELKALMKKHGHDVSRATGMSFGSAMGGSDIGRLSGSRSGGQTNTDSNDPYPANMKPVRGDRVA